VFRVFLFFVLRSGFTFGYASGELACGSVQGSARRDIQKHASSLPETPFLSLDLLSSPITKQTVI
jgi:hypothetical protein